MSEAKRREKKISRQFDVVLMCEFSGCNEIEGIVFDTMNGVSPIHDNNATMCEREKHEFEHLYFTRLVTVHKGNLPFIELPIFISLLLRAPFSRILSASVTFFTRFFWFQASFVPQFVDFLGTYFNVNWRGSNRSTASFVSIAQLLNWNHPMAFLWLRSD